MNGWIPAFEKSQLSVEGGELSHVEMDWGKAPGVGSLGPPYLETSS